MLTSSATLIRSMRSMVSSVLPFSTFDSVDTGIPVFRATSASVHPRPVRSDFKATPAVTKVRPGLMGWLMCGSDSFPSGKTAK